MSTIQQNLTRLQNAKTAIATAITNKGGIVSIGDGFEDFASDIENIPTSQESGFSVTVNVTSSILNLYLSVYLCVNTTIDIDWGDGTTHSIVSYDVNTEQPFIPHTYLTTGIYTINVTFIGFGLCAISGSYNYGCALITSGYYTPTYSSSIISADIRNNTMLAGRNGNDYAFSNCSNLTNISLSEGITILGNKCFYYCFSLTSIIIPSTVTKIKNYCFDVVNSLNDITFLSTTPPTAELYAFSLPTTCKIHIPPGTRSVYTSAANYPSASTYTYIEDA